jgi:hypothetical protein
MRFKLLILSALLSVAFLAIVVLCANWDNQQDLNADQLLSGGETETITPPTGMAATPQKQRAREANKTSLDWTMPSTIGGSTSSPISSRAAAESSQTTASSATTTTSTEENLATNETNTTASSTSSASTAQSELPPSESTVVSAGGSWSLALNDTVKRDMALSLFQNGESIYGAGNIREGNSTTQVTASGSVKDGKLNLDVVSVGSIGMYKMVLDLNGDSGSGTYQAFSANGDSWQGSVEGSRTASQ